MATSHRHVLVLFEPGRAGVAAVDLAREVAMTTNATVTVLGVVPEAPSGSRCGNSATEFNVIVREAVARDLERALERLTGIGDRARSALLTEGSDPPLHEFVASSGIDVVLLPSRRRPLRSEKHPAASALRRSTAAEVRVVDAR